ncbi:hypothetical protein V8G54_012425 [Vigna mungo]|uniref:POT1A/B-like OB fold domain-containing protein n=1 Tax=Vigna mungo TaxID=3915 RepID=A0AAQ3S0K8_VIGMU
MLLLMCNINYSKVTTTLKCIVRVVTTMSCKAENLYSSTGKYRMQLMLEDSTAKIHANVIEEDVMNLFYEAWVTVVEYSSVKRILYFPIEKQRISASRDIAATTQTTHLNIIVTK